MSTTHFLHIRKTGGIAVKTALAPYAKAWKLRLHRHETKLEKIPSGERICFFLRDPVSRFVSGFNSRLRQGRPRLNNVWNEGETQAFANFVTPNALAEALGARQERAFEAMAGIRHINQAMTDWIGSPVALERRISDIVWIGRTETLNDDFARIKSKLGLPESIELPADDVAAHRTPPGMETALSEAGRAAIRAWYADDYRLLETVDKLRLRLE